jgi:hypothetical protein
MSDDNLTDAQREKAELIEQALLMNLILSLDTGPEGCNGEVVPPQISPPPPVQNERQPPGSEA